MTCPCQSAVSSKDTGNPRMGKSQDQTPSPSTPSPFRPDPVSLPFQVIQGPRQSPAATVVHLTPELFESAFALYRRHTDKQW
jgi:hypothetical protein